MFTFETDSGFASSRWGDIMSDVPIPSGAGDWKVARPVKASVKVQVCLDWFVLVKSGFFAELFFLL